MNKFTVILAALSFVAYSCNEPKANTSLDQKKEDLAKLKTESADLKIQIKELEVEIALEDPTIAAPADNAILVSTAEVVKKDFVHRIDVRGTVESRKNVSLSSEMAGRIIDIKVKEGQKVKKGDIILVLDSELVRRNIDELQNGLEFAQIVFQRQKNLWDQNIGSEIQFLEAKNSKESLEKKLATAQVQLSKTIIRAPFSGSIDALDARVGEIAQPGFPLGRMVSLKEMYLHSDISESHIGKVDKGDDVDVSFPALGLSMKSRIDAVGQVINPENRTFTIEISLLADGRIRPNQVASIDLKDYMSSDATIVPTNLIQKDSKGDFVFGLNQEGEILRAKKIHITTGVSYRNETEVLSGLEVGDKIIDLGFRDVSQGVGVKIASN